MLDTIFSLLKSEISLGKMQNVLYAVQTIMDTFHEDYLKDKSAKNAAIDAVIQLLQQHKDP